MNKSILKSSILLSVFAILLSSCTAYPHYHTFDYYFKIDNNHHWLESNCKHKIISEYGLHNYDTMSGLDYIEEINDESRTVIGKMYCQTCLDFIDQAKITDIYDDRLTFRKIETLEDNNPLHKENEPRVDSYSVASHVRKEDVNEEFGDTITNNNYGDFIIPDTYQGLPVNFILPHSFEQKRFTSLTFGKNIEGIGDSAFVGSRFESDLIIPDTIKYIERNAFLGAEVKKIIMGEGVKEIMGATFENCRQLEEIVLNDNIWRIDVFAFDGCNNLKKFTFPKGLEEFSPTAFNECYLLKDIVAPKENKHFMNYEDGIYSKDKRVLYMPIKLTNDEYNVPNSVDSIANCAFRFVSEKVKNINLNKNLKCIDRLAFSCCWLLEELKIPNKVVEIKERAFVNSGLTKLTLPKSVKILDGYLFNDCWALTSINYEGSIADWDKIEKSDFLFSGSKVRKVNCSDGSFFVE